MAWFWQNITWWLFTVIVGAVVGYLNLKNRWQMFVMPVVYAVAVIALLWVIRLSVQGVAFFSSRAPLNVANIEKITREWLIDFGAGVRRVEAPDCEFAYEVTLESGRHVSVSRRKRTPNNVLSIQAALKLSDDDQRRYEALQPVDAEGVLSQARLEIARSRLGYEVNRARPVTFALRQDVPLTPDLTQFQLIDAINDVDLAVVAVRETLLSALQLRPQGGANR